MAGDAVELFFSYSHRDEALRDQLATHLKLLERQGIISSWHDRKIVPGSEWAGDINNYLSQADIILLLVSADFLASDYCWDIEIQKALARHEAGTATVIPVILRPVDWSSAPFARLQAMPKNAQPVVTWDHPDLAFMDIAKGIRLTAEKLRSARRTRELEAKKQSALQEYRQQFKTYLASGAISFIARENLTDLAQTLGLTPTDIAPVEAEETAVRNQYLENLERYGQTFRRALDHEHPLSQATLTQLHERKTLLNLEDSDVKPIEERILKEWHTGQVERQQQVLETQRQQELDDAEKLRQHQLAEERRERERQRQLVEQRLQREKAELEERRRQQESAVQQKRQQQAADATRQAQQRQPTATPQPFSNSPSFPHSQLSRRRALQLVGLGGGSLAVALVGHRLWTQSTISSGELLTFSAPPPVSGTSPDNLSAVGIQSALLDADGRIVERRSGMVNAFREELGNGIGLDLVQIRAGDFVMGSPPDEEGRFDNEGPQHPVSVPSFFMGRFPVTQAQYEAVMGSNPSHFTTSGANRPVEQVSWENAVAFCEKLSQQTGRTYRLPSEAEWEYACRAGTTTPFHFGETISTEVANYNGHYDGTTGVGTFNVANAFGLYDMHGNVYEWCQDVWNDTYEGAPNDGGAWLTGDNLFLHVFRGGSWFFPPRICRSANRVSSERDNINYVVGFRVVVSVA
jgi:formylglycine-generating enzyme required for sulfatase activity